jgi:hypothetical protein
MKITFDQIINIVNIKQSERKIFLKLFLHSFLIGVANSFFLVETSKVFIFKVSISEIPIAYIISGIIGLLLIYIYKKAQTKIGEIRSYELLIFLFFISSLIIYGGQVYFKDVEVLIKLFAYLGFAMIFAFLNLFNVGFAGVCFSIFNFSQSKRLLGLLGIGEVVASIIGFLVAPLIVRITGNSNLLLLLAMLFSLISIFPIRSIHNEKGDNVDVLASSVSTMKFNISYIVNNPYVLYLSLTTLFSMAALYFVDYSYLISVRSFSSLYGIETTAIVGYLFCFIKTGELIFSLFTYNIISKIGMKQSGLILPNLLLVVSGLCFMSILLFFSNPVFIIVFLFMNKCVERIVRKTISAPARKVMFQINTPEERIFLQNNIDGVMMQVSTIISGLLLLFVCFFYKADNYNGFIQIISVVNFIIFLLFLVFSIMLFKNYQNQIHKFLNSTYSLLTKKEAIFSVSENTKSNEVPVINGINILNELSKEIDFKDKKSLLTLIAYYNPSSTNNLIFSNKNIESEDTLLKVISRLYIENQNYFSRFSIISYIFNLEYEQKFIFFKEVIHITPIKLRIYFLNHFESENKSIPESQLYFLNEQINLTIKEIFWTDSCIDDLKEYNEHELVIRLELHRQELSNMLLSFVELNHDKNSVIIVKNIINKSDLSEEDLFFVCELLDNILLPELKSIVIPVFEPTALSIKKSKLSNNFFFLSMTSIDRITDILMHDFNLIDSYTKQLALNLLKNIKPDHVAIKAFESSRIVNLSIEAKYLDEKISEHAIQQLDFSKTICQYFLFDKNCQSIFQRWIFRENKFSVYKSELVDKQSTIYNSKLQSIGISNLLECDFKLDLVAIILLNKLNQDTDYLWREAVA